MCGIAGYMVTHPKRISAPVLQAVSRRLLSEIEIRGRDATGYSYVSLRDKCVYLAKAPVTASEFLKIEGHILTRSGVQRMPRAMILHTRAATQGNPNDNKNNHPIYAKQSGLCMIHNGWISNDDMLVQNHKLPQDAEVDSEVYLRLIEKFYLENPSEPIESSIQKATKYVFGSLACAMIQGGRTDTMWVWRDSGALAVARTDWGYAFASTKDALLRALLANGSSLDTALIEVTEPPPGTMYTWSSGGHMRIGKVSAADWQHFPAELGTRVHRTYSGGRLTRVSRARNNDGKAYTFDPVDYDSEYDGYGYRGYYKHGNTVYNERSGAGHETGHSAAQLPYFSRSGSGAPNSGAQSIADKRQQEALPKVDFSQRRSILAAWEAERPKNCYCRYDYCCFSCQEIQTYFGKPVAEIEALFNSDSRGE